MAGEKYGGICLITNAEGLVRTDMPDGSVQYLEEEAAMEIIVERMATARGCSEETIREMYGLNG